MQETMTDRKDFYQILTRKIGILILVVSFIPMMLTAGILCYRFRQVEVRLLFRCSGDI